MAAKRISQFFEALGFPLLNARWSWGAHGRRGVLLRAWADDLDSNGRHVRVLAPIAERSPSPGLGERIDHLRMLWAGGLPGYAVIAVAVDADSRPRKILSYAEKEVRAIDALLERPDGSIWAALGDAVPVEKLRQHSTRHRLVPAQGAFPRVEMPHPTQANVRVLPAAYVAKLPAMREWLVAVARDRQTVTYRDARAPFNLRPFEHRHAMDRIGHDCLDAGEPILTSLIVDKHTGRCSSGFTKEFKRDDIEEREDCYEFWSDANLQLRSVPTKEGAVVEEPGAGGSDNSSLRVRASRFARTAVRPDQAAFRRKVFMIHRGTCVVTGCAIDQALDAAHRHGRDWRLGHNRAEDGLLLRKDIHALYDAHLIHITEGRVEFDYSVLVHYRQFTKGR